MIGSTGFLMIYECRGSFGSPSSLSNNLSYSEVAYNPPVRTVLVLPKLTNDMRDAMSHIIFETRYAEGTVLRVYWK